MRALELTWGFDLPCAVPEVDRQKARNGSENTRTLEAVARYELGGSTVLPRQPLDVVPLASPARFADNGEDRTRDLGQGLRAIAGHEAMSVCEQGTRVHENEAGTQGP
jgi:hypothetical protein